MAAMYPKRPKFFALRFCRVMAKVCLANEIGPDGCWLLAIIANTEDAKGYRDAVTYFNGQLMPLVGCKSDEALNRLRVKAATAGWLHYQAGGKGKPGRYWVIVPEQHRDWDDAPSDESRGELASDSANGSDYSPANQRGEARENRGTTEGEAREKREVTEGQPRENRGTTEGEARNNRGTTAEHSSLSLSLSLSPNTPLPPVGGGAVEPPTPDITSESGPSAAAEPVPTFAELVGEWVAAHLPGWNSPAGIQRTPNRVGHWQARLRDPTWATRWREAVRRAGRSARCRGEDPKWPQGLRLDTFLANPDFLVRVLEGEFDSAPGAAPGGGKQTVDDVIEAARKKRNNGETQ